MKLIAMLLLLYAPAFAQKMHVKIVVHTVDGRPFTRLVPGIALNNGNATANCGAYGSVANCSTTAGGSSVYLPPHTIGGTLAHIQMVLLLPGGRHVEVSCDDHFGTIAQSRLHTCKNPEVDDLDADFSGANVKLTWGVGLDGKKKETETFSVGKVFPAEPPTPPKP